MVFKFQFVSLFILLSFRVVIAYFLYDFHSYNNLESVATYHGWKNLFGGKVFKCLSFLDFYVFRHKISSQEEHPIHNYLSHKTHLMAASFSFLQHFL